MESVLYPLKTARSPNKAARGHPATKRKARQSALSLTALQSGERIRLRMRSIIAPDIRLPRCQYRRMRILLMAAAVLLWPMGGFATTLEVIKPYDFQPLSSLPWKAPDATLDGCMSAIFREPNPDIRYPVLAAYLRTLSPENLAKGFDMSIRLEGAQTPDALVEFYLEQWAEADPEGCWKRMQHLFLLVGVNDNWATYGGWMDYGHIPARHLAAIRASPFWIDSRALKSFPLGLERTDLPKTEEIGFLRDFADMWFDQISPYDFNRWPGYPRAIESAERFNGYTSDSYNPGLMDVFSMSLDQIRAYATKVHGTEDMSAFEATLHRWLQSQPSAMPEILKALREAKWQESTEWNAHSEPVDPSAELLLQWAKLDQSTVIRWADSPSSKPGDSATLKARGMLMSRADAATRNRWLVESGTGNNRLFLLQSWADWDPDAAVQAAVQTNNPEMINEFIDTLTYGSPFDPACENTRDWDLERTANSSIALLPPKYRSELFFMTGYELVSSLSEINIADAARFGVALFGRADPQHHDDMIRYFSGKELQSQRDIVPHDLLCVLREWAIVRPKEMQAWIGTLSDPPLQKALTWLLDHPWGKGDS